MIPFRGVVIFGPEHDFLFKSASTYCELTISRVFLFFHNYFIGQKLCIKALLNRKKLHYFPAAAFSAAAAAFFSCFSLII